ncbi:MAG: hypothetical protein IPH24_14190 [Crocinitomicaceae bacterium]|nr:hypothetical protein [Crocinitomicaceae bacterium]
MLALVDSFVKVTGAPLQTITVAGAEKFATGGIVPVCKVCPSEVEAIDSRPAPFRAFTDTK